MLQYYEVSPSLPPSLPLMAVGGKRDIIRCAVYEINYGTMTSSGVEQTASEVENK